MSELIRLYRLPPNDYYLARGGRTSPGGHKIHPDHHLRPGVQRGVPPIQRQGLNVWLFPTEGLLLVATDIRKSCVVKRSIAWPKNTSHTTGLRSGRVTFRGYLNYSTAPGGKYRCGRNPWSFGWDGDSGSPFGEYPYDTSRGSTVTCRSLP